MAGRLSQAEIALLREEEHKGRLTQSEIVLLREEISRGRLTQTELVLLREDEIPPLLTNEGGWGFIPFGTT
jgi:hypothetical protein